MTPNSCLSSYFKNKSPCFSGQAEGSSDDDEPGYVLQSDEIRARKVRTRLVSKIKERKKNFSFGFSVQSSDEGTQADVGEAPQQEATAAQASGRRRTKKKKKQASVQRAQTDNESQDREQAAPTDVFGDAIRLSPVVTSLLEGSRAHTNGTCPSSSPLRSSGKGDPPLPAAPAPALRSPPGLEVGAAQSGRHELQQQQQQHAQPGVRSIARDKKGLVHFDSWRHEGLSEEEKARKRYGQGVRNVTAIARRSTTGPGVIGKRVEDDVQGVKAMTTAFSFGFALG